MRALYVHIPYCRSKCAYCDFSSVPVDDSVPAYLEALAIEAAGIATSRLESVYVGGGTPTVLSPGQIAQLFEMLRHSFDFSPTAEITIEANPCSVDADTASTLAACGVNRVSIGAQSFIDSELAFLGRAHCPVDIPRSVSLLRNAGIANISIDLMYALPNQTPTSWRQSLNRAIELRPEHVSTYCLTFEPSTPLRTALEAGEIRKKSDDEEIALYEIARDALADAGYEHYEISNFALPGIRSRHNMVYWSNEEYLGLGASAVSYVGGERKTNLREPAQYVAAMKAKGTAICEVDQIAPKMQAIETMIQRLRLRDGIDRIAFENRFGIRAEELFNGTFSELIDLGLIECESDTIRPTAKGFHLANEIALRALS